MAWGKSSRCAVALAVGLALSVGLAACSGGGGGEKDSASKSRATTVPREPGASAATVEGPITRGAITPPFDPRGTKVTDVGYTEHEWFASGTATRYVEQGDRTPDGDWTVTPAGTAPYKTRIVVRMPADPASFHGVVALEWLNVSAFELAPDWAYLEDSMVDDGVAWVGVSAQALGIEGGTSLLDTGDPTQASANQGLKVSDPARYGSLTHPGDAYSFDIYSQVAAALRGKEGPRILGGSRVKHLLALGESQSAGFLTAYINGIDTIAKVFDGYFVHSRFGGAANYDGSPAVRSSQVGYRIRTDLAVPVFVFETETDVLRGYALARQPDTDRLRVWEVAGTGHSDTYLVGDRTGICPSPINDGPQHWVANAAFTHLISWVSDGTPPPHAKPLESHGTELHRDARGTALGGVRTPDVDVPIATLSGATPPNASQICSILGSTVPFDKPTLRTLYTTKQDFLDKFTASLDDAIARGYVRPSDREAYLKRADNAPIPG